MDQILTPRGVYVTLGVNPPPEPRLEQSLLLLLGGVPSSDQPPGSAELFWCPDRQHREHIGTTRIVALGVPDDSEIGEKLHAGGCIPFSELEAAVGACATFLGQRRHYRRLLRMAGIELATRLLLKAHDIAALQARSKSSRLLRELRHSGALTNLLVSSEEQFAFLSLQKLINENDRVSSLPPAIESIDGPLVVEERTRLHFTANYGDVLGELQPISAVIGANGVGKTRLLLALSRCAHRSELVATPAGQHEASFDAVVRSSDIVSFTFEPGLWARHRRNGVTVIGLGVGTREWKRFASLLQQLALSDRSDFQVRAYINVVRQIVKPDDIWLRVSGALQSSFGRTIGGKSYFPLSDLADASEKIIGDLDPTAEVIAWSPKLGKHDLSSGQRSLMLMIAHLFVHCQNRIVLIDEPENHLHPQYVTMLMRTLRDTLIATESRSIVVTHSPFVVRELDKGAVQVLVRDDSGLPCLFRTSLQTFGGDVGQITDYVFGDRQIEKGYEVLIRRTMNRARPESRADVADRVSEQVGDDAELYLQQLLRRPSNGD